MTEKFLDVQSAELSEPQATIGRFFITESQTGTGLHTYKLSEAFFESHHKLICHPVSVVGQLALESTALFATHERTIKLGFDAKDMSREWFGWHFVANPERYEMYANRRGDRFAIRYTKDKQGTLLRREVIQNEQDVQDIHHILATILENSAITETFVALHDGQQTASTTLDLLQHIQLTRELDRQEKKALQLAHTAIGSVGFQAAQWRSFEDERPRL